MTCSIQNWLYISAINCKTFLIVVDKVSWHEGINFLPFCWNLYAIETPYVSFIMQTVNNNFPFPYRCTLLCTAPFGDSRTQRFECWSYCRVQIICCHYTCRYFIELLRQFSVHYTPIIVGLLYCLSYTPCFLELLLLLSSVGWSLHWPSFYYFCL